MIIPQTHITVLLKETIEGLELKNGDVVLDATLNDGGHSKEICKFIGENGTLVGTDQDETAVARATENLKDCKVNKILRVSNFRDLDKVLDVEGIEKLDGAVFDLGLSSNQLDLSGRGFTFQKDEPLLMTFKVNPKEDDLTAKEIVNTWEEENLKTIIEAYGEEKFAWRIAKAIVEARKAKPIVNTGELVKIITEAVPFFYRKGKINPATKTFQALRITVNDEIGSLNDGLEKATNRLKTGGRIAVISFHSIEDRIVKRFFKEKATSEEFKLITKKPIVPSASEITENPRSRSAKLRILERIK